MQITFVHTASDQQVVAFITSSNFLVGNSHLQTSKGRQHAAIRKREKHGLRTVIISDWGLNEQCKEITLRLSLETDQTWSKPDSDIFPRPWVLYSKLILIINTLSFLKAQSLDIAKDASSVVILIGPGKLRQNGSEVINWFFLFLPKQHIGLIILFVALLEERKLPLFLQKGTIFSMCAHFYLYIKMLRK